MNNSFTAIDFETAQGPRWSICQVGLVRVENGKITDELSILVKPPDNYYFYKNIEIHGITPEMTVNTQTFDKIWPKIKPYIKGQNVVAHNGFSFDFQCLAQSLEYYNIEKPEYEKHCTYKIFGKDLATLCEEHNIELNHHNALSDALACTKLFLLYQKNDCVSESL